ncbi:protein bicaudal C homolog 1-B-like [Sinocyclocheilus rhinocerous]|uniref:protein bicaudal C homolog 1-B-like n=1 Tax=Sinocyclocheilus rhinocerous TaxID=307959 RepID=UPI0007BA345D|nr:PREDICTED: protein bicaudal C homolog 1-B-like [Sinocyclocheilus rhinocerous]
MAAQCEPLSGYLQQSDPGSNSERSADSPLPVSEDDSSGPTAPPDPEWTEERFRVDRKKLEIMLLAATEGRVNGGEDFFQKVMEETDTQIAWPSKLKIGAKSKKDPHIKVSGKRDNVKEAKEKIMSVLDTKSNRVTLKMDVSHTEHSHVIGKGGNNIKKVMEDTGCHIHFPDSNRNNQAEKSNQVSIAGQPGGVEAARARIRELLPLVLMFELPVIVQLNPDPSSPAIQHISQTYNISVAFKQRSRLYGATGVVRGSQNNAAAVKRGTAVLLEHLTGNLASAITVSTQLDIAPQHHLFMMGRNGSNIKHIMQRTGAQVHFPDPNCPQKKSTVYVQGTIDSVCLARQYLMGCLPLVLMFDIKEDIEVEPQCITSLMEQLDVFISVKPKPKQPSKATLTSILLSGVPGYTQNTPSPPPGLAPIDAQVNGVSDCSKAVYPLSSKQPSTMYSRMSAASLADKVLTAAHGDSVQEASPHCPSEPLSSKSSQDRGSDTFVEVGMPRSPSHSGNSNELKQMLASCKTTSGKRQALELLQGTKNSLLHSDCLLSDSDSSTSESPPKHSLLSLCSPLQAFDYEQKKLLATKAMLKKPVVTEVRTPTNTWSGLGFSKSMPAETIKELRRANHVSYKPTMSTTYEGSPLALSRSNSREGVASGSDSDNWRERNGSGLPVHSDFPSPISPKRKQNKTEHYLSSSNYMDCISSVMGTNGCNLNTSFKGSDLPELFSKLGLGKYTDVFQQQEIDLQTFLTLTDQDLKELGITTFGARRKMLLAISELNKNRRKLFEPPNIRSSFLEGGASGRLPRQFHADIASVSGRW